jgi:hypothetical protein
MNILRFKETIEFLYYLSGPILAILGFAAYFQLKVMKKTQIFNATIELHKFHKENISKSSYEIKNILTNNGIDILNLNVIDFELEKYKNEDDIKIYKRILLSDQILILDHINNIELFATTIISTSVNESILYKTLGYFMEDVKPIALFIAIINQNKIKKRYNNTIKLYNGWEKLSQAGEFSKVKSPSFKSCS